MLSIVRRFCSTRYLLASISAICRVHLDHPLIFCCFSFCVPLWLPLRVSLLPLLLFQYAQVVASENPDLIKCFVEKMPLPPHLEGNAIALQLVDYAQVQKKQWTVETGNQ